MAKQGYSHQPPTKKPQKPLSNMYSTTRSAIDSTYLSETSSSRLPSSSRHFPEASTLSLSSDPPPFSSLYSSYSDLNSSLLWPSFDVSSAMAKRPAEALYNYSPLGAHMLGQSEAWLTSDTFAKRPRVESAQNLPVYPQRPGEKDCAHYMLTRTCKFGDSCKFDHPIWVPVGGIPDWKEMLLPPIPADFHPERPGEPDCPYFIKTQKCKFGLNCKFNHPKEKSGTPVKTDAELPERPSEPLCSFYAKTGKCKFGAICKFHHPKDLQIVSDVQAASIKDQPNLAEDVNHTNGGKSFITDPASSYNSKGLPIRQGEEDCPFYMKTGSCKYAANCRYNHPDRNAINPPVALVAQSVLTSPIPNLSVGLINPTSSILQSLQPSLAQTTFAPGPVVYPQRPGQSECEFYMKTGVCKYGLQCRFHHPTDRSASTRKQMHEQNVKLTLAGLPRREGVSHCPFYMKTGTCKYGVTCKFDHPPPGEVMALSGKETSDEANESEEKTESEEE